MVASYPNTINPPFHPNIFLEEFFPALGRFNGGVAVVSRNGNWGAIDRTGREVVPFVYDFIYPFNDELSAALNPDGTWSILEIVSHSASMTTATSTTTQLPAAEISVYIDGHRLNFEVTPQMINGRTMLPLREWDNATRTATITTN